jgi:putative glycerol-1-phosphate prenyltransferase
MNVYERILNSGRKQYAVLIDPDKCKFPDYMKVIDQANASDVDFFFLGGSLITRNNLDYCIEQIREYSDIPIILFPGDQLQISSQADAILLLSLISGRNPDLLIGKHVVAAPYLKESGLDIIATGYMLIANGIVTTAEYMSNTNPIPRTKDDIAMCTALAGEMLGLKLIYLDAGSGAKHPVPESMIRRVKENIHIPLITGGGIRSAEQAADACMAGADVIVTGNAIESDPELIKSVAHAIHQL